MTGAIICGVDDSRSAKGAARVARALGSELGRDLIFFRAVERDAPAAEVNAVAERLERLSSRASGGDCGAAWLVEVGHPADALVAAATKLQASLIVVGSTGPRSSLLGSVSAEVSRRAPCPVVVVPPEADVTVNGRASGRSADDRKAFPGGIVRVARRNGSTEFAGGIARFGLSGPKRG